MVTVGALLALSGCTKVEIEFTRAERINVGDEKSAGRPLELVIVAATKSNRDNNKALGSITSYDWFKMVESDSAGPPFGIPKDQIWYYADGRKAYAADSNKVSDALAGDAQGNLAVKSLSFTCPSELFKGGSVVYIFARYQDSQNGLRKAPPIEITDIVMRNNPAKIYVGPTELRREK